MGPVKTQFGYHILEVTEAKPEQTRPLSEVESQIRTQLSQEEQSEAFSKWLDKQKKQRDVKYLERIQASVDKTGQHFSISACQPKEL